MRTSKLLQWERRLPGTPRVPRPRSARARCSRAQSPDGGHQRVAGPAGRRLRLGFGRRPGGRELHQPPHHIDDAAPGRGPHRAGRQWCRHPRHPGADGSSDRDPVRGDARLCRRRARPVPASTPRPRSGPARRSSRTGRSSPRRPSPTVGSAARSTAARNTPRSRALSTATGSTREITRTDGCGIADWTELEWLLGPPER